MLESLDLETEYNNRLRVPEHVEINARWLREAEAVRAEVKCELDLVYGQGPRHAYDLFYGVEGTGTAPLVVFIHGGYWQRGDRKTYSFVARELTRRGVTVAVPSYTLAPAAPILDIVGELRHFLGALWTSLRRRPLVIGNSAGGHLTAAMVATDWSTIPGVPRDLVRAGYALSGVYDLAPLIPTSINAPLKLNVESARAASPLHWPLPPKERRLVAAVGGQESQEFFRQSLDLVAAWSTAGIKAECLIVPDTNHFTILDELTRADSAMVTRVVELARECVRE